MQLGEWRVEAILLGLQTGLLSAVLISINNLRDREEDAGNNKRTVAVIFGSKKARFLWLWIASDSLYLVGVPLVYLALAVLISKGVSSQPPGKVYNKYLALGGLQLIIFGLGFHLAVLL